METVFNHIFHAIIISIILYLIMKYGLKQSMTTSLNRSVLLGSFALIYMILFGHKLPLHINKI